MALTTERIIEDIDLALRPGSIATSRGVHQGGQDLISKFADFGDIVEVGQMREPRIRGMGPKIGLIASRPVLTFLFDIQEHVGLWLPHFQAPAIVRRMGLIRPILRTTDFSELSALTAAFDSQHYANRYFTQTEMLQQADDLLCRAGIDNMAERQRLAVEATQPLLHLEYRDQ